MASVGRAPAAGGEWQCQLEALAGTASRLRAPALPPAFPWAQRLVETAMLAAVTGLAYTLATLLKLVRRALSKPSSPLVAQC